LAKITNILPDSYGVVRAVEVLINNSLQLKTLNKLVPLEVNAQKGTVGRVEAPALPPVVNYNDLETPDQASDHDQRLDTAFCRCSGHATRSQQKGASAG